MNYEINEMHYASVGQKVWTIIMIIKVIPLKNKHHIKAKDAIVKMSFMSFTYLLHQASVLT